jgi:hypothetical protein
VHHDLCVYYPTRKEKNKSFGENQGTEQSIGNKQYQQKWLQHVKRMDTDYHSRHWATDQKKDEGTYDDRERDGLTNFSLRIKE